jgi:hypothetical protein
MLYLAFALRRYDPTHTLSQASTLKSVGIIKQISRIIEF